MPSDAAASPPPPTKHLESYSGPITEYYEIGALLGTGAFSKVFRGRPLTMPTSSVALKIVDFNAFKQGATRERQKSLLEAEIQLLDTLQGSLPGHKNLAKVMAVVREGGRVCIVMEELKGKELFDRIIERNKFTELDAAQLFRTLMCALKDLHKAGVVHRDLKPENLIYADSAANSDIKITDFGLGLHLGSPDPHGDSVVGTAGYVAPEILLRRSYGPSNDVWSMGVILYILLCGYPPFHHTNNAILFELIKKGKFVFHENEWQGVSQEAKSLISHMLTVDANTRYTIDQVLDDPWLMGLAQQTNNAELTGAVSRLRTFNAKRKLRAAAMAVMVGARFSVKRRLVDIVESSPAAVFNLDQLCKLRDAFKKHANEEGKIDRTHFSTLLGELGFDGVPIDQLFRLFDATGAGQISYRAFLTHMSTLKEGSSDAAIRFCFDAYDVNGDGSLSREEVGDVLRTLLAGRVGESNDEGEDEVERKIEDIYHRLDQDGNGTIDYEEFKQGVMLDPVLIQAFLTPIKEL
jgi:calcium-dependent protein kinase